jgi:hypothetical protein
MPLRWTATLLRKLLAIWSVAGQAMTVAGDKRVDANLKLPEDWQVIYQPGEAAAEGNGEGEHDCGGAGPRGVSWRNCPGGGFTIGDGQAKRFGNAGLLKRNRRHAVVAVNFADPARRSRAEAACAVEDQGQSIGYVVWRHGDGQRLRWRGSSASRRPSPMRLKQSTMMKMARPGKRVSHQAPASNSF